MYVFKKKFGGEYFSLKEHKFLTCYLKEGASTYLDVHASFRRAYSRLPHAGEIKRLINRPRIMSVIREMLSHPDYDTMIDAGFRKILRNPRDKNFPNICKLIFLVRGDLAPQKSLSLTMSSEDLAREQEAARDFLRESINGEQGSLEGIKKGIIGISESSEGGSSEGLRSEIEGGIIEAEVGVRREAGISDKEEPKEEIQNRDDSL